MSKKVKIFVIVILVIAALIALFSYLGNKNPTPAASGLSSSATETGVVPAGGTGDITPDASASSQFSATLLAVNSINLDTSIFSNPAYEALRDYPVALGTAIIGRVNPFAPIGSDAPSSGVAPSLQVQTLAPGKITASSTELGALVTVNTTAPVTVVFEYGLTDSFGTTTPPVNVTKSGTALFTAKGLTPATQYYVQAIAVQGSSTATSNTMSFTTLQ